MPAPDVPSAGKPSTPLQPRVHSAPEVRDYRAAWILTGPALILMVLILLVPVAIAGLLSFTDYSLGSDSFNWIGSANYEKLFTRASYEKMFVATLTYVVTVVPLSVAL